MIQMEAIRTVLPEEIGGKVFLLQMTLIVSWVAYRVML